MNRSSVGLSIFFIYLVTSWHVAKAAQSDSFNCDGNTLEIVSCFSSLLDSTSANLDTAYKNLSSFVRNNNSTWATDLITADKKWKDFRELNCTFDANYLKGGSGAGPVFLGCKAHMTADRVVEIRRLQQLPRFCESKKAEPLRTEQRWIKLSNPNQAETATETCQRNGFKIALKVKRCDTVEVDLHDYNSQMYIVRDAISYEKKGYADLYKLENCKRRGAFDSVLCESAPDVFECTCIDKTTGQHSCVDNLYKDADKELNKVYQSLIRLVRNAGGDDWVNDLRAAELKWIEFRDQNCVFYNTYLSNSANADLYLKACKVRLTQVRTLELKNTEQWLIERGH